MTRNNLENIELLRLKRSNVSKIETLNNNLELERIELEKVRIREETAQKEAMIDAYKYKNIQTIKAEGIKSQAENRA